MPFLNPDVVLRTDGPRNWQLVEDLVYRGKDEDFVLAAGYVTDLASSPRMIWWLVPSYGLYTLAAILHDWLCTLGILLGRVTARDADAIFRRVMRELGVPPLLRWLMWAGVRWGAVFNPLRRPGVWRDMPAVLGISLLAAPIVMPASLLALLGLGIYGVLELLVGILSKRTSPPAKE